MEYQEYRSELLTDLRNEAAISGTDTGDEFITYSLQVLSDFEEINDPVRIGMGDKRGRGGRIMRLDGYSFDDTDKSLIMFISDFQDSYSPDKLTMSRVDELYWRLYYFLDEACNGKLNDYFDDSDEILGVGRMIKKRMKAVGEDPEQFLKIKFFILTNKELDTRLLEANLLETTIRKSKGGTQKTRSTKKIKKADFEGKPLEINLWPLERLHEMETSNSNEPIVIDIEHDFPALNYKGIPCIKANVGDNLGYIAYIAIIPGNLLSSIYIEHGSKVLEGNVRAFLGTSGSKSVNRGIKTTINNDPTKFFTYNNGIATTASGVETQYINGELYITKIVDLQIINGGQTTATLAESVLKKNANASLSGIFVPMKLTVIEDRESEDEDGVRFYDRMVQDIALYANSQNKVTAADLFSNQPFHIWMEKTSKKHFAPPKQFSVPTGWYYERSRKRYEQEQVKLRGEEQKRFLSKFPKKQIINKEQLALYMMAINERPDIVSRGKNYAVQRFGEIISEEFNRSRDSFNDLYFEKCICAAIIYRTVDNYLESNKDSAKRPTGFWYRTGGYKLNIVPYTVAKIMSSIPDGYSLNWKKIWDNQAVSPAFMGEIERLTKLSNDFICDSHGLIVTEYCKKESTWEAYKAEKYQPSEAFLDELIPDSMVKEDTKAAKAEQKEVNNLEEIMNLIMLGPDYWSQLLTVGKSRSMLSYQEQTALNQMITMARTGNIPNSSSGKVSYKTIQLIKTVQDARSKLQSVGINI